MHWSIPHDTLAMVHAGEMIIPSAQAAGFRGALSDGGSISGSGSAGSSGGGAVNHYHVHAHTLDGASFGSYLRSNSRELFAAMDHGVRNGNHIGLRNLNR